MSKSDKLNFTTTSDSLESFSCGTITQVIRQFVYLERWGSLPAVKTHLPTDYSNVQEFFRSARKMSDSGFQEKKFKELWIRCNMTDITDYSVNGSSSEVD